METARAELAEAVAAQKRIKAEFQANEAEAGVVLTEKTAADSAAAAASAHLTAANSALADAEKGAKGTRDAVAELKGTVDELEATMTVSRELGYTRC